VEGSYEHGTEPACSIKCWEIFEQLRSWRALRKGSAPWSYFTTYEYNGSHVHDVLSKSSKTLEDLVIN
jgi:hypothetical protein